MSRYKFRRHPDVDPRYVNPEIEFRHERGRRGSPVATIRLHHEHQGHWWTVEATTVLREGVPVFSRVEVEPWSDNPLHPADGLAPGGVTGTLLRSLPLGALKEEVRTALVRDRPRQLRRWIAEGRRENTPGELRSQLAKAERVSDAVRKPRRGRPQRGDDHYAEVAETYLACAEKQANVHAALEERFGVSRATINRWVAEAEQRGFLTPARRGGDKRAKRLAGPRLLDEQQKKNGGRRR